MGLRWRGELSKEEEEEGERNLFGLTDCVY